MHTLIDQIETSLGSGLYFLSLYTALTIPDIAGALSSENGEASGTKYAAWFESWVRPRFFETVLASLPPEHRQHIKPIENPLTGDACYRFRCSLLHQGSSQHPKSPFTRIMFIEPGATTNVLHYGTMNDALCIDLNLFCREMISGARLWLKHAEQDANYIKNYERFARRHDKGLAPYIVGVPVVG
jgi:hypothetical protein